MNILSLDIIFVNFRNINGFLNTGKGGTIYLGIVDDGKVKGLLLTQYQVSYIIIIIIILYLPTCHLGAESSFKRERETNYK